MYDLHDLVTIKSKDDATKRAILEELTQRCGEAKVDLATIFTDDGVVDLSREDRETLTKYCLLAVFAADVATIQYTADRVAEINVLRKIAQESGLSFDKVVYLTRYADQITQRLEKISASS